MEHAAALCVAAQERGESRPGRVALQRLTGITEREARQVIRELSAQGIVEPEQPDFTRETLIPSEAIDIDALIARRKVEFARQEAHNDALQEIVIRVNLDGPIALAHFGDPHVDDPGSDIGLLQRHMQTCRDTPGMFACNVGDAQNNWGPRLAHLWALQETKHSEALQLVEWMLSEPDQWLYLVGGNHDAWSGQNDPLQWLIGQAPPKQDAAIKVGHFRYDGLRVCLLFPNGRRIFINARHDFKGSSQNNPCHGLANAAKKRSDHIFTCGHRHHSGHQIIKTQTGIVSHLHRVCSYKVIDAYASKGGFDDEYISPCVTTIIDPSKADDDPACVTSVMDPEMAASILTCLRAKAAA